MAYDNGITFDSLGIRDMPGGGKMDYVNVVDRWGNPLEYEISRYEANWKYKRRYSPAIAVMMDAFDPGDPFGSAMEMANAVCLCAWAMENPAPAIILQFRPGAAQERLLIEQLADGQAEDAGITTADLASAIQYGQVDDADLTFAAKVLNRYISMLDSAGQSY